MKADQESDQQGEDVKGFWRRDSDLKKMEACVRCFKCKKVGHFSRNCLSRKGQGKGSGASSTSSTARVSGSINEQRHRGRSDLADAGLGKSS